MIVGLWHPGSGLGDQLFCCLAARITAERLGVPFTMVGNFKGESFINLDYGVQQIIPHHVEMPAGKIVIDNDFPIYEGKSYYDPEFNFIQDNTIVDGCRLQDSRYWHGFHVREWLQTEPLYIPHHVCLIGFRGGEYATVPELFLPYEYYESAIKRMKEKGITKFEVHTDDPVLAKKFFPDFECIHDISVNWRSMRCATHAIIPNSAFYIIPRLLSGGTTIAPRRWSRPYEKDWSFAPQNYYKGWQYI